MIIKIYQIAHLRKSRGRERISGSHSHSYMKQCVTEGRSDITVIVNVPWLPRRCWFKTQEFRATRTCSPRHRQMFPPVWDCWIHWVLMYSPSFHSDRILLEKWGHCMSPFRWGAWSLATNRQLLSETHLLVHCCSRPWVGNMTSCQQLSALLYSTIQVNLQDLSIVQHLGHIWPVGWPAGVRSMIN